MAIIKAPFNQEQVDNINEFQTSGMVHEFTCVCRKALVATEKGMVCPACGRTQDWVHDFMADGSLKKHMLEWRHNIFGDRK
jgi:hypothetical protein